MRAAPYFPGTVAAHNTILAFYQRLLSSGLAKKAAICPVMCKLIHIALGVLKSGKPFDSDYLQKDTKKCLIR